MFSLPGKPNRAGELTGTLNRLEITRDRLNVRFGFAITAVHKKIRGPDRP